MIALRKPVGAAWAVFGVVVLLLAVGAGAGSVLWRGHRPAVKPAVQIPAVVAPATELGLPGRVQARQGGAVGVLGESARSGTPRVWWERGRGAADDVRLGRVGAGPVKLPRYANPRRSSEGARARVACGTRADGVVRPDPNRAAGGWPVDGRQ